MKNLGIPVASRQPLQHRPSRQPLRLSSDRFSALGTPIIDGGIDITRTVTELMKDVAKAMKDVPFVEGIAGVVFRIIKICDVSPSSVFSCSLQHNYTRK